MNKPKHDWPSYTRFYHDQTNDIPYVGEAAAIAEINKYKEQCEKRINNIKYDRAREVSMWKEQCEKLADALEFYKKTECHSCMIEYGTATQEDFDSTNDHDQGERATRSLAEYQAFKEKKK